MRYAGIGIVRSPVSPYMRVPASIVNVGESRAHSRFAVPNESICTLRESERTPAAARPPTLSLRHGVVLSRFATRADEAAHVCQTRTPSSRRGDVYWHRCGGLP